MYLIVGLGNPGKEYEQTRHNLGFMCVDTLANKLNIQINKEKFKGMYGEGWVNGEKILLLKPLTYMNLSGQSIAEIVKFYKIQLNKVIVIYDDIDIKEGSFKVRKRGSARNS